MILVMLFAMLLNPFHIVPQQFYGIEVKSKGLRSTHAPAGNDIDLAIICCFADKSDIAFIGVSEYTKAAGKARDCCRDHLGFCRGNKLRKIHELDIIFKVL